VWRGGGRGEPEKLASCYRRTLALAVAHGAKTVAFPAISCGIFGYPIEEACAIAVAQIQGFLEQDHTLEKVVLVAFSADIADAYRAAMAEE